MELRADTTFLPTPFASNALNAWKRFRFGLLYFSHNNRSAEDKVDCMALFALAAMTFPSLFAFPRSANIQMNEKVDYRRVVER